MNLTEKTSLKCPSKSNFDSMSDLTTLCPRQIEPSGIIVANFYTTKPRTQVIPYIFFCNIYFEYLVRLICVIKKNEEKKWICVMAKYEQIPNVKPSLFTRARGELNTDPGIRATKETDIFFPILKRFRRNTLSFFLNLIFSSIIYTSTFY